MQLTPGTSTPSVRILGAGCASCRTLAALTDAALVTLGLDLTVETIDDPRVIAEYQVMRIPALVNDGRVILTGRSPKLRTLCTLIEEALRP